MGIKQRIIDWWDWKVYWLAYKTFNRMCKRNQGFAYLFKLNVDKWLRENPLPPELERATESFFASFVEQQRVPHVHVVRSTDLLRTHPEGGGAADCER